MRRGGYPLSPPSSASPLPPFVLETFHNPDSEWEERVSAFKALSTAAQSRSVRTPGSTAREAFLFQLRELALPLSHCISDLRSTPVKEVCICITELAQVLGAHFVEAVGNDVIAALLKRSNSTKAVIRESAINAARAMFENGVNGISFETARLLSRSVQDRKIASSMRSAAAQFLGMILVEDCLPGLQTIREAVEDAIIHGCEDPDEHVRAVSRENWRRLERIDLHVAHQLLNRMPSHVTAILEREKNGSPRNYKISPKGSDHSGSPYSPSRLKSLSRHRPPLTAKRAYPQRIPNGSTHIEVSDTSPTGGSKSTLKSHTTSTSTSSALLRVGARHRTGAARVPRPPPRGNEHRGPTNGRQGVPPRPALHLSDATGVLPTRGTIHRNSIARPPRPARRSVAPSTTINFQSLWSPPGAAEPSRRKARQSVPVAIKMPSVVEDDSIAPAEVVQIGSPPSQSNRGRSLSPLSQGNNNKQRSPLYELTGKPTETAEQKPDAVMSDLLTHPSGQMKSEHRSPSSDRLSSVAEEERNSPSTSEFVRGIVAGAIRSLRESVETKAGEETPPGKNGGPRSALSPEWQPHNESNDILSVSTDGSTDQMEPNKSTDPPLNLRKGRLSFILGKTVSPLPPAREAPRVKAKLWDPELALNTVQTEASDRQKPYLPLAEKMEDEQHVQTSASRVVNLAQESLKPTPDDIALLMAIASCNEEKAEQFCLSGLASLSAAGGVEMSPRNGADSPIKEEIPSSEQVLKEVPSDTIDCLQGSSEGLSCSSASPMNSESKAVSETEELGDGEDEKENERRSVIETQMGDEIAVLVDSSNQTGKTAPSNLTRGTGDKRVDQPLKLKQAFASHGRGARRSITPGTKIEMSNAPEQAETSFQQTARTQLPKRPRDVVVRSSPGKSKKKNQAQLRARAPRRSIMPGTTIPLQEAGTDTSTEKKVDRGGRPPRKPQSSAAAASETSRPPSAVATTITRKARPRGGVARRSVMPGSKIKPFSDEKGTFVASDGEEPTRESQLNIEKSSSEEGSSATQQKSPTAEAEPTKKKKMISAALQGVIDWLKQANRIKRGGWEERCQALKGFGEACQQLDGERIGVRLAEDCISMLGDYVHETHHKVVSCALNGLFFLLLCSVGSSSNLQKALEKRDDLLRRTLGLLIGGKANVRLAAGRVIQSFEVQFRPEVMVSLIMRALGQVSGSEKRHRSVADGRVAEMGCVQLDKAFERAATSGEGFLWKTGLLECVLTGLDGMTKDRRAAVRKGAEKVVEKVRISLPDRAFEMACEKYGVGFVEMDNK